MIRVAWQMRQVGGYRAHLPLQLRTPHGAPGSSAGKPVPPSVVGWIGAYQMIPSWSVSAPSRAQRAVCDTV